MSFRARRYTETIRAISKSFTRTRSPTTMPDTPATTPVRLGITSLRSQSRAELEDSSLGRMSEFSHCSREAAEEL